MDRQNSYKLIIVPNQKSKAATGILTDLAMIQGLKRTSIMGDIKMLYKVRLKNGRILAVYSKCRERVPNKNDTNKIGCFVSNCFDKGSK